MRLNPLIGKLERGEIAAGAFHVPGHSYSTRAFAQLGHDFAIIETEHLGFNAPELADALHGLLVPGEQMWPPRTAGLVRVPANGREMNEFFVKQALDQGAFGILFPTIETVEQARAAVAASRYPQATDSTYPTPVGRRGAAGPQWGLTIPGYYEKADLWPLNPDGELILVMTIETKLGVENLDAILTEVEGIGAILAGQGDMSYSYGFGADFFGEQIEDVVAEVLETTKKHNVACFALAMQPDDVEKRVKQGFDAILSHPNPTDPVLTRVRALTG
jgi:4-hydroxy-2-oxoheptanedioate aldolase